MEKSRTRGTVWGVVVLLAMFAGVRQANAQDHWVATWAASPQAPRVAPPRPAATAPPAGVPTGNNPPAPALAAPTTIGNQTVRMVVRTSLGGHRIRVQLSNAFDTSALTVGAAHVALHGMGSEIVSGSDRALTFGGKSSFTIPAAAEALSDPVELDVPKLGDLAISLFIPNEATTPTVHATGLHTTYISQEGDFTGAASITDPKTAVMWYWISGVEVEAPAKAATIVAFGDSITDGATSTPDMNKSWPSQFAERLAADKKTADVAIVNEGISGNRMLNDGAGVAALARFDRDVLAQPGIKWLIVLEGINDIGLSTRAGAQGADAVTAEDIIGAHKQIIARAHLHGIKVLGATLTPYEGAAYESDAGEAIREQVNDWIRTSHAYDAVIDFEAAVRDPANPKQILPAFNIRDHLHPNDDGYKAMAGAIDLSLFEEKH